MVAAAIGAAATIGSAAISASSKGGGGGSSQNTNSVPWGPQANYLEQDWQNAAKVMQDRNNAGPYTGDFYAGLSPAQQQAIQQATQYGGGIGSQLGNSASTTANYLLGNAGGFSNNAARLAGTTALANPGLSSVLGNYAMNGTMSGAASVDPSLSSALNTAALHGATSIGDYNAGLGRVMNSALTDPTGQLTQDAQSVMNSSPVQSAISSTNNMIDQTLNEQTVPGLNRQAAMGGALNSSRAGMAEAMANENAALAKGNADAQILNNAFNTGLGTAAQQRTAGLTAGLAAANDGISSNAGISQGVAGLQQSQHQFDATSRLGAAQSGLSSALGYDTLNNNTQLQGNSQLGNALGLGFSGGTAAMGMAGNNINLLGQAGALDQSGTQLGLSNDYQKWLMQNGYGQSVANDFNNIVGSRQFGSQTTDTSTNYAPNNTMGRIGGLIDTVGAQFSPGGGLYNALGLGGGGGSFSNASYTPSDDSSSAGWSDWNAGSWSDYGGDTSGGGSWDNASWF